MNALQLIFLSLFVLEVYGLYNRRSNKISYQNCQMESFQRPFDVLPGTGWDNLANIEMGRVLDLNFSFCLFSNDNKYLIPNGLSINPIKYSHLKMFSETFNHFMNYTSMTAFSINIQAKGAFIDYEAGGSFSYEKNRIKNYQLETKSLLTRVQLKYKIYQSMFEPDTVLYPGFKNRIMDIASLIIENKDSLYPHYLADMVVRDYGTHVIRSINAGAILSKTDALNTKYVSDAKSDLTKISASASASFMNFFSIELKHQFEVSNVQRDEYNKNCLKTHVDAIGGSLLESNFTLRNWERSVMNNLVPIDRRGDPIYYVLTPRALPELDDETVYKLHVLIKKAVDRYYKRNMIQGCIDFNSPNFNPDANVDAGNCKSPYINFTLGGVYQTCIGKLSHCPEIVQKNPLTGDYSCPEGFSSINLNSGIYRCENVCDGPWVLQLLICTSYQIECSNYNTYWCSPNKIGLNHNGYQFGGIVQNSKIICPMGYIPLRFGLSVHICVTTDSNPLNPFIIKSGGFYSCNVGNPLAYFTKNLENKLQISKLKDLSYWPKSCAEGYFAHIVAIDTGCEIAYCTETNKISFGSFPKLVRPPFIKLNYNPNSTKVMIFKNKKGDIIMKNKYGYWKLEKIKQKNPNTLLVGILSCFFGMILVCLLVAFLQRRYYKRKINQEGRKNLILGDNISNYGMNNETENL